MRRSLDPSVTASDCAPGTLLYVTDLADESGDALAWACQFAEISGGHLELVHVVDPMQMKSKPDGSMDVQHRLELLVRKLRSLKRDVASILMFGAPKDVIPRRAAEVKARFLVFELHESPSLHVQEDLIGYTMRRVSCPVIIIPQAAVAGRKEGTSCAKPCFTAGAIQKSFLSQPISSTVLL